jgi:hypothetical protein
MISPRLILIHKQSTSGRVRFLRLPGGVLCFAPVPRMSALRDEDYRVALSPHPAAMVRQAEEKLRLPSGSIRAEAEFRAWVDTPDGDVPVLLAAFTSQDPPFKAAERLDGKFIAITEARSLPQVELHLLRRAYEYMLG